MMKFGFFGCLLRRSLFGVRHSAVYPPQAGSLLNFQLS